MQTNETFFNMAAADVVRVCERAMAEGRPMLPELMREHARQEGLATPPARPAPRPAATPAKRSHQAVMASLKPAEKTFYFRQHEKAIRAEALKSS